MRLREVLATVSIVGLVAGGALAMTGCKAGSCGSSCSGMKAEEAGSSCSGGTSADKPAEGAAEEM